MRLAASLASIQSKWSISFKKKKKISKSSSDEHMRPGKLDPTTELEQRQELYIDAIVTAL